jgi:hypothetical protein
MRTGGGIGRLETFAARAANGAVWSIASIKATVCQPHAFFPLPDDVRRNLQRSRVLSGAMYASRRYSDGATLD